MIQSGVFYRDTKRGDILCYVDRIVQYYESYHPETDTYTRNGPVRVEVSDEFDSYGPMWHSTWYTAEEFTERFVPVDYDQLPEKILEYEWVSADPYTNFPKKS